MRIGFIGAGQMATALARGFIAAGVATPDLVVACDVSLEAGRRFTEQTGAATGANGADVLARAEVIFLAVKPQHMSGVLSDLRPHLKPEHLIVSIAAGVSLAKAALPLLGAAWSWPVP